MPRIGLPSLRALDRDEVENDVVCVSAIDGIRKEGGEIIVRCSDALKTVERIEWAVECAIVRLKLDGIVDGCDIRCINHVGRSSNAAFKVLSG